MSYARSRRCTPSSYLPSEMACMPARNSRRASVRSSALATELITSTPQAATQVAIRCARLRCMKSPFLERLVDRENAPRGARTRRAAGGPSRPHGRTPPPRPPGNTKGSQTLASLSKARRRAPRFPPAHRTPGPPITEGVVPSDDAAGARAWVLNSVASRNASLWVVRVPVPVPVRDSVDACSAESCTGTGTGTRTTQSYL